MPDVVVRLARGNARAQRQHGLGPVERLDLRFLVDTEDERLVRWVQIHADHVAQFLHELGIATQLEGLDAMGLQPVRAPDPMHDGVAQALRLGHGPNAPVRGLGRGRVQRGVDDLRDRLGANAGRRPGRGASFIRPTSPAC